MNDDPGVEAGGLFSKENWYLTREIVMSVIILEWSFIQNVLLRVQGVLAQYDFWDFENIVPSKIRTSEYYIANFH